MTDEQSPDTGLRIIQTAIRRLVRAVIAMYLVLACFITVAWIAAANQRTDIARVTSQTTSALCTLRGDLERRVAQGETFLAKHPNGIQGISATAIQQSIANEQRTVDALRPLSCSQGAT